MQLKRPKLLETVARKAASMTERLLVVVQQINIAISKTLEGTNTSQMWVLAMIQGIIRISRIMCQGKLRTLELQVLIEQGAKTSV